MEKHLDEAETQEKQLMINQGKLDVQHTKQEVQQQQKLNSPSPSQPPSSTSSPSHEFSFTISLPPPTTTTTNNNNNQSKLHPPPPPPPFAATIDLSPADEIFFHGHLLPLHLLPHHHPISPDSSRSSTNSLESTFTLTLKDGLLIDDDNNVHDHDHDHDHHDHDHDHHVHGHDHHDHDHDDHGHVLQGKVRGKSRSFSHLFPKWRKHHHHHDHDHDHDHDHHHHDHHHHIHDDDHDDDDHNKHDKIRKSKFENIVRRYMRLVRPFIHPFRHKRAANAHEVASFNSYARGSLRVRKKKEYNLTTTRGRRSEFSSAPVSNRTSPTNSGLLVASGNLTPTGKNDSTMEELHAAIQAAIAHCKSSIAEEGEEKKKK